MEGRSCRSGIGSRVRPSVDYQLFRFRCINEFQHRHMQWNWEMQIREPRSSRLSMTNEHANCRTPIFPFHRDKGRSTWLKQESANLQAQRPIICTKLGIPSLATGVAAVHSASIILINFARIHQPCAAKGAYA